MKMPKYLKGRNFTLTLNNYAEEDLTRLQSIDWILYGIVGKEVGAEGTKHLQGYIQAKRDKVTTASGMGKRLLKAGLSSQPHCEIAKGTYEDNVKYCSKDGDVTEWGVAAKAKGARRDIATFLEAAASGKDDCELAIDHPEEFAKYHKAAEKVRKKAKQKKSRARMMEKYEGAELRQWQADLVAKVEKQNDRQVTWVIDPDGGMGKSWLANWLYANKDTFIVDSGKQADIAHAYDCEAWVVFDLTRSQEEYVNYQVIESFKNGRMFSPKYESSMKIFEPAKLLVFANWGPDKNALSKDRWDIVDYSEYQAMSAMARTAAEDTPDEFKINDSFWCTEARAIPK